MKTPTKWIALVAVMLVGALGLVACGGNGDSGGTTNPAAERTESGETMEMGDGAASGEAAGVMSAGTDLRVTLDRLLGEHAMLAMFATQKGLNGDKDFEAIAATLDQNSVELADAIGSVYGDEARQEFLDGNAKWRAHIGFFVDYTTGLAKDDRAMQRKAVDNLGAYIESFSAFLADATELPQDAVTESITEHVGQLKGQIDAYAAGDYEKGYGIVRGAYAHMFMTGDTLAGAISEQSPEKFAAANVTTSAADLRVALNRLFGEHAILAMIATQKGHDGDKDFESIAAALDQNSQDLADAIGSIYGPEAAKEFLDGNSKWRAHIGFFVDYTTGLAMDDQAMQKKAVDDLGGYVQSFSAFLADATGLPKDAVTESITEHVNQLKGQIDAYAAGDYEEAYSLFREAYAHMFMTGDTVAGAIVAQSPDKFSS